LTSTDRNGAVDLSSLSHSIEFVVAAGVDGICVNGATGEYCRWGTKDRKTITETAHSTLNGRGLLLVGIGAVTIDESIELGRHALDHGADKLLLPPPHYFRYSVEDIAEFYRQVAEALDGEILIYNLPVFTNPVETALTAQLVSEIPNVVGMKDSSGSLDALTALRKQGAEVRWMGNDGKIAEALKLGLANGAISGVAGVFPEVVGRLFEAHRNGADLTEADSALQEIVNRINQLPTPWALKVFAASRGLGSSDYASAVSTERRSELADLRDWYESWAEKHSLLTVA